MKIPPPSNHIRKNLTLLGMSFKTSLNLTFFIFHLIYLHFPYGWNTGSAKYPNGCLILYFSDLDFPFAQPQFYKSIKTRLNVICSMKFTGSCLICIHNPGSSTTSGAKDWWVWSQKRALNSSCRLLMCLCKHSHICLWYSYSLQGKWWPQDLGSAHWHNSTGQPSGK